MNPYIHRTDCRVPLHTPFLESSWILLDELRLDCLELIFMLLVVVAVLTRAVFFDAKNASLKALAVKLQALRTGTVATTLLLLVRGVILTFGRRWSVPPARANTGVSRLLRQ